MNKVKQYRVYTFLCITFCTLLNVIISYITNKIGLPLYLDTIGTVLSAFLDGFFPGIITALSTNLVCEIFNPDSVYYTFIGVLIAACAALFSKNELYKKKINLIWLIMLLSLIGGGFGIIFQMVLLGQLQFGYVIETAEAIAGDNNAIFTIISIMVSFALNFVDKGLSVLIAVSIYNVIPKSLRIGLWNNGWNQTPLSKKETKSISAYNSKDRSSFKVKVTVMLFTVSVALTAILSMVSMRIIYNSSLNEGKEMVQNVARFVSQNISTENFKNYLSDNEAVSEYENPDYEKNNEFLLSVMNSFYDVTHLYIYHMKEEAGFVVFDTSQEFQKNGQIGERIEYTENFLSMVPQMLKGEALDVMESSENNNHFVTALEPLRDENGKLTSYYVGVDIALKHYSTYIRTYVVKMLMLCSGFFVLIVTYGLFLSAYNFVYPIGSLEKSIDEIMKSMDDQDLLEKNVKKLQKLDIRTNDEIERLYKAFSEMAIVTADQMRNSLTLANSNKKMQSGLIITMADIMEGRGLDSKTHFQRTTAYVRIILTGLKRRGYYAEKLTDKYMYDVETSAPLYDIGKINIPENILNKHGKLTAEEEEILKGHTLAGKKILENAISTVEGENYLKEARNMAAYHHERWDGQGYPEGLHGEVIPLSARIMAVADYFEDLTSSYDDVEPVSAEKAMGILKKEAGTRFDPKCVEVFVLEETRVRKTLRKYQET